MAEDLEIQVSNDPPEEELTEHNPDAEPDAEAPIEYDLEAPNMVPSLLADPMGRGKEALDAIANKVYREVDDAWQASEQYRKRAAEDWKIWTGDLPPKSFPFENCANAHIPSFMEDGTRLMSRMFLEAFDDFTEVFSVSPVGPDDQDVAEMLSRHGNWQLQTELLDFPAQMERAALFLITPGDVTVHSFYDPHRRINRHEVLTADDVIVPYVHVTTMPDYSDCPWVAKWLRLFKHELQSMRDVWHDVDDLVASRSPSHEDEPDSVIAESQQKIDKNEPGEDQRAPYKLVHYEGWIELPDQPDEMFCKVVMDWSTKRVLQLQLMLEDDWKDRARFNRQQQELQQFQMASNQAMQAAISPQVDPMSGMPVPAPPSPPPPQWAEPSQALDPAYQPDPVRRVPIHMFTHAKAFEPPTGPLGAGQGRVLSDLNKAANVMLSQFIDSATLANVQSYLAPGGVQTKKPLVIKPGAINPVPGVSSKDIDKVLISIPSKPANPQMMDVVKMFRDLSEGASQAPSVLAGEAGKSGETYRGLQTRIEQATKNISFMTGKLVRLAQNVIRNNARLNAQFLPEEEIVYVNNHKLGTSQELTIGRAMYDRDYRVVMSADLRFSSLAARVAEADQLLQLVFQTMPANTAAQQAALKEVFIARGKDNLVPLLGPPLPPPQTPLGIPPPPPPGMQPPPGAQQHPGAQPAQGNQGGQKPPNAPPSAPSEGPPAPT